jgi:hypothetical protein
MAVDAIQFVDAVSATANIRLSLSAAPWSVLLAGTDVSPPPLRRAVVSTLLADGAIIPAAAYDNRSVRLHLQLDSNVPGTAATQVQLLRRELDRARNILRWQPEPAIPPVYFMTHRSPETIDLIDHGIGLYDFSVDLLAEPFSLGHREDVGGITVNRDPNAGSNARFFEITGVKGDVETPLRVTIPGSAIVNRQTLFALRRRGTPSAQPGFIQAESMTLGTDTTVPGGSDGTGGAASPSGAGSNTASTSFATNTLITRLSTTAFPSSPSVDARGTYRFFVRVRPGTSGATFSLQLQHGVRAISNPTVTATPSSTNFTMVDLGLVQMPEGVDPVLDGPGGTELTVVGVPLSLKAQRLTGTGTLIWDNLIAVPADDRFGIVSWGATTPTNFVYDGTSRTVYGLDASGRVADISTTGLSGDFMVVSPGVTNRITYINDVNPVPVTSDPVASTTLVTCSYWPQYLACRPVSS